MRARPDHNLTTRQTYVAATGRVLERRIVALYRLMLGFGIVLGTYVGIYTWWDSGSFRDSLAPMVITMMIYCAIVFRLTRRFRWAGFSVGPYAGEVEASLRRAQGGVHLLYISGVIAGSSLFFYAICVSWAFPLS
ncbi:hypothetical protein [Streptomyces sp. NPDC004528]|uniref:hypothetical protein n=1 Tax=Streptomyces sp. NPDC004528 TaxID=3154550 RepID=UPI0033A6311F